MNRSKLSVLAAAVAAIALGVANRADVPVAITSVRAARPAYLIAGVMLVAVSMVNLAAFHASAQRAAGESVRTRELVVPVAGAGFMNLAVKSGAMAGLTLMLTSARRRRRSPGPTIAGYLLVNVLGHVAFAFALLVGFAVLVADGRLQRLEVVAAAAFGVLSALQIAVVGAALRSRSSIRRVSAIPRTVRARMRRVSSTVIAGRARAASERDGAPPADVSETDPHRHADELFDAVALLRGSPRRAAAPLVHALIVEVLGIAELWCVLRALHASARLSLAIVAYAVSVLFTIVGILPAGLGLVEVGLGTLLVSSGLTRGTAIAVVVIYRVFELWLPAVIGVAAVHRFSRGTEAGT